MNYMEKFKKPPRNINNFRPYQVYLFELLLFIKIIQFVWIISIQESMNFPSFLNLFINGDNNIEMLWLPNKNHAGKYLGILFPPPKKSKV